VGMRHCPLQQGDTIDHIIVYLYVLRDKHVELLMEILLLVVPGQQL
jgi:hypothetical protein